MAAGGSTRFVLVTSGGNARIEASGVFGHTRALAACAAAAGEK